MRAGRLLIIIAILVILALAAVYAILQLSNQDGSSDNEAIPTSNIVMMIQPVERGGFITADMLDYLVYPTSETIETMFTNFDDVVGLQARYDLEPGIPVTSGMLVGGPDDLSTIGSDQALLIPEGMVAFPITIDRFTSLGYGLRAGDHVNVIATMLFVDLDPNFQSLTPNNSGVVIAPGGGVLISSTEDTSTTTEIVIDPLLSAVTAQVASGGSALGDSIIDPVLNQPFYALPSEAQRPRLVSQTLMQDVVVLHIGNSTYTDENGEEVLGAYEPQSPGIDGTGQPLAAPPKAAPDLITLIVSPQDAVTLNYMLFAGAKLTMALRSSGDASIEITEAVTLEYLVNSYNIPLPSKLPFGLEPNSSILSSPTFQAGFPSTIEE